MKDVHFAIFIHHIVLEVLVMSISEEKVIKWIQFGKEEEKLLLFAGDVMLFIEYPTDATPKSLDLVN